MKPNRNRLNKNFLIRVGIVLGLVGGVWAGCGYQLAGSGRLPEGIVRIFVAEPVNHTSEARLISIISNELKNELNRRQTKMVGSQQEADGVLKTEIRSLTDVTIARRGETTALEKRVTIQTDVKLERPDGKVIWQGDGIAADGTYVVISSNNMATGNNRQAAINQLAQRLAEDIYNRLSADF